MQEQNIRHYAESQVSATDWICLDELWDRESSWRTKKDPHRAVNRSSGAYGIPQALPASKMATAGKDFRFNPKTQVKWGLNYINQRYGGSACKALEHHNRKGWY
jgi:soluble lytic murein transglycosylase-like protein